MLELKAIIVFGVLAFIVGGLKCMLVWFVLHQLGVAIKIRRIIYTIIQVVTMLAYLDIPCFGFKPYIEKFLS